MDIQSKNTILNKNLVNLKIESKVKLNSIIKDINSTLRSTNQTKVISNFEMREMRNLKMQLKSVIDKWL